jgi:hypothetical protein
MHNFKNHLQVIVTSETSVHRQLWTNPDFLEQLYKFAPFHFSVVTYKHQLSKMVSTIQIEILKVQNVSEPFS